MTGSEAFLFSWVSESIEVLVHFWVLYFVRKGSDSARKPSGIGDGGGSPIIEGFISVHLSDWSSRPSRGLLNGLFTSECFNDWGGWGYDDSVPGNGTKTTSSGDRTTLKKQSLYFHHCEGPLPQKSSQTSYFSLFGSQAFPLKLREKSVGDLFFPSLLGKLTYIHQTNYIEFE